MAEKQRITWLDVLKFIGILEIYIGHLGHGAGYLYPFVFTHHVPLFFFVSGCLEYYNKDNVLKTVQKKVKGILIPWLFLSLLSIVANILFGNATFENIGGFLEIIFEGCIRNRFFAAGLWFLTAIFVVTILFQILKQVKFRILIFLIALFCNYAACNFLPNNPLTAPSWYYNVDSALAYLIYFALGYCLIEFLNKLVVTKAKLLMVLHYCLFAISAVFTAYLFFGRNLIEPLYSIPKIESLLNIVVAFIPILFWFFVAFELKNITLFANLGKQTLWFCGNEFIVKDLFIQLCAVFGLTFSVQTPITAIFASFMLLMLVSKFMVPWQKKILDNVNIAIDNLFSKKADKKQI